MFASLGVGNFAACADGKGEPGAEAGHVETTAEGQDGGVTGGEAGVGDSSPPMLDEGEAANGAGDQGSAEDHSTGDGEHEAEEGDIRFDLGGLPDWALPDGECDLDHKPCDDGDDPWQAMALNCPDEPKVTTHYVGDDRALIVLDAAFGSHNPPAFPVLEGKKMVMLSTGKSLEFLDPTIQEPNTQYPPSWQAAELPPPIDPTPVAGDCLADPSLVGSGDCSKTIADQWAQAGDEVSNAG